MYGSKKFKIAFFTFVGIVLIFLAFMIHGFFKGDDTPLAPLTPQGNSSSNSSSPSKDRVTLHLPSTDNDAVISPANAFKKPFTFGTLSFKPETQLPLIVMPDRLSHIVGGTKDTYVFLTDTNDLYYNRKGQMYGISETINTFDVDEANNIVYYSKNFGDEEKVYRYDLTSHDQVEIYNLPGKKLSHLEAQNNIVAVTYYPFQYGQTETPTAFETKWIRYFGADTLNRLHEVVTPNTNANPSFAFDGTKASMWYWQTGSGVMAHTFDLRTNIQATSLVTPTSGTWNTQLHLVHAHGNTALYDTSIASVTINDHIVPLSTGASSVQFIDERFALILESCMRLSLYDVKTQKLLNVRESASGVWTDGKRIVYQEGTKVYQVKWNLIEEKTQ